MTNEQFRMVEHSYGNGDDLAFMVGDRIFVSLSIDKNKDNGTVEFMANEVDESCFYDGEYFGDTLSRIWRIILKDPCAGFDNMVETRYFRDEIKEMK